MNPEILKTGILFLLITLLITGCQKDKIEYADESIVVSNRPPGLVIYKLRGDYLDKTIVTFTKEGTLNTVMTITEDDPNYEVDKNGNVKARFRHLLKNGYVVGGGKLGGAYTDITFKEYLAYNKKHGINHWPLDLVEPRIVDRDPYIEFYGSVCHGYDCHVQEYTLGEIYEMLENGTIEEHFTRYK